MRAAGPAVVPVERAAFLDDRYQPQPLRRPPSATRSKRSGERSSGRLRMRDPVGAWHRLGSGVGLLVTAIVLGVLLASVLAVAIGAVVITIQHALNNG